MTTKGGIEYEIRNNDLLGSILIIRNVESFMFQGKYTYTYIGQSKPDFEDKPLLPYPDYIEIMKEYERVK